MPKKKTKEERAAELKAEAAEREAEREARREKQEARRAESQARREARAPRLELHDDYVVEVRGEPGKERVRKMPFSTLDKKHKRALELVSEVQASKDEFYPDETWSD